MPLKDAAIIKLQRSDFAGPITVKKASVLSEVDGPVYSLFEQAKSQLNKSAQKRFGFFDDEAENQQLKGLLKNWQAEQMEFLSFVQKSADFLQQQLDTSDTPLDFFVIFAHESILEQHYFYVFAQPMKEMMQYDNDLQPLYTQVIDSARLSYAFRIHLEQFEEQSPKYLTQVAAKGAKDITDSFNAFSTFKEGIDIKQQTEEFIGIVDSYAKDMDEETEKKVKTQIMEYCVEQDAIGIPVQLEELSEQLDEGAPDKFAEYVKANQQAPNREVHTDRSTLKRYMRYFGRDNSLSINFSSERLGSDIFYQPGSGSLRIDNVPKALKKQLASFTDKLDVTE